MELRLLVNAAGTLNPIQIILDATLELQNPPRYVPLDTKIQMVEFVDLHRHFFANSSSSAPSFGEKKFGGQSGAGVSHQRVITPPTGDY